MTEATEMRLKTAAACIHRNEYREEVPRDLRARLKDAGIVAIYGASDDITVFDGALHDEAYPSAEGSMRLTQRGQDYNKCDCEDCPNWKPGPNNIRAQWDHGGYSWFITTDLPHETFDIVEGDDLYCRGVVVRLADLPA